MLLDTAPRNVEVTILMSTKPFCETLQSQEELYIKGMEYLTFNSEPLVLFLYILKKGYIVDNSKSQTTIVS